MSYNEDFDRVYGLLSKYAILSNPVALSISLVAIFNKCPSVPITSLPLWLLFIGMIAGGFHGFFFLTMELGRGVLRLKELTGDSESPDLGSDKLFNSFKSKINPQSFIIICRLQEWSLVLSYILFVLGVFTIIKSIG